MVQGKQVFVPRRLQSITAGTEWVPENTDTIFAVTEDTGYKLESSDGYVTLIQGTIRGIAEKQSFYFSIDTTIEVG